MTCNCRFCFDQAIERAKKRKKGECKPSEDVKPCGQSGVSPASDSAGSGKNMEVR